MCLNLIRELFAHQAWADVELLLAVAAHPGSCSDKQLLANLHHIVVVQRAFAAMLSGAAFDVQKELRPVETTAALQQLYTASHRSRLSFVNGLTVEGLDRPVQIPWFPELQGTAAEILMQVILHSQNHRGQCLTRQRELAGQAPMLDFIVWLNLGRPGPVPLSGVDGLEQSGAGHAPL